ncbi:AraC family transcriptional regulator [Streptococcus thoraltensis]|uniref:AraC family transcriptional regulator n=1 Tax=Streptococcus thoraltensis TaxID=55085 RepID=UPI000363C513|nr:AraC family transcriptional regulator [Streptococcus thoraltensis]MDY4761209.1 AraC family transcriptional regulator [Streptococcus thoraltensis]
MLSSVYFENTSLPIPIKGIADSFASIINRNDANNDTSLHWHNSLEIVLVLEGCVKTIVNGKTDIIAENQCHIVNSNAIHSAVKQNSGKIQALVLQISDNYLKNLLPHNQNFTFLIQKDNTAYQELVETLHQIVPHLTAQTPISQFALASLVNQVLFLLFSNFTVETTDNESFSGEIIDYINSHYTEALSLDDLATISGFQKNYFCRKFKKETGVSFTYYLNNVRLNAGLSLLSQKQSTALECALEAGFASEKNMIYWCQKIHHCSPNEYVKQLLTV